MIVTKEHERLSTMRTMNSGLAGEHTRTSAAVRFASRTHLSVGSRLRTAARSPSDARGPVTPPWPESMVGGIAGRCVWTPT
jgi:hypothetical protein